MANRGEPVISDEPEMVRADQIEIGDVLDLEGDPYADQPTEDHTNSFEFEMSVVTQIERETADCVAIGGEGFWVGFPPDHMLKRHGHDSRVEEE